MSLLFKFRSFFQGDQLTPFAPMCGHPCHYRKKVNGWINVIGARIVYIMRQLYIAFVIFTKHFTLALAHAGLSPTSL